MVAHLNIHTSFDLLDSSLRIDALIDKAKRRISCACNNRYKCIVRLSKFYDACIALTYIQSLV